MSLTTTAQLTLNIDTSVGDDLGTYSPFLHALIALASGTAASQIDRIWGRRRTIASSGAPDTIDLTGGGLTMTGGAAADFAKVCWIIAFNRDLTQTILIGGNANPFASFLGSGTDKIKIVPAVDANTPGVLILGGAGATVFPVTAGTGDIWQAGVAAGTNVIYDLLLLGRSV
jgi:hypothetical protein